MEEEEFEKKYEELSYLFLQFMIKADFDEFDDNKVIKYYFDEGFTSKQFALQQGPLALKQAQEVLQLDPFPEALISDLTNTISPIETRKEWLEKVVQKLQKRIDEFEKENNQ